MKDEKTHIKVIKRRIFVRSVREYYLDVEGSKNDDPIMKKSCQTRQTLLRPTNEEPA